MELHETHAPRLDARAAYRRVLASWAQDVMELRRRGLDRPTLRRGAWSTGHEPAGTHDKTGAQGRTLRGL